MSIQYLQSFIVGISLFAIPASVWATAPENTSLRSELASFQVVTPVSVPSDIVVPTVVALPVSESYGINQFAVVETTNERARFVPYTWYQEYKTPPAPVTISTTEQSQIFDHLSDGDATTFDSFAVQSDTQAEVTFVLQTDSPVMSSGLQLTLAPNVARPENILIEAGIGNTKETVLNRTKVTSTKVSFPVTSADTWYVTYTYAQPLRIAELTLQQDIVETSVERGIRFLAQPGQSYAVYADPEVFTRLSTSESGNVSDVPEEEVVMVAPGVWVPHAGYQPVDSDTDGIPDQTDNCVQVFNFDQTDVNNNGRGDACDDFDRDGVHNYQDNCPNEPNRNQSDADGDGLGDVCDSEESRVTEKYAWIPWLAIGITLGILGALFFIVHRNRPSISPAEDIRDNIDAV